MKPIFHQSKAAICLCAKLLGTKKPPNRDGESERIQRVRLASNNPEKYVKEKSGTLKVKLEQNRETSFDR